MSQSLNKNKKLIPISEAAKFLSVSIDTIRRWDKLGILHSERPNGKNRYFALDELEKHKLAQPLGISEAARLLKVSTTTLRRLEKKELIACQKSPNGERGFRKDDLENFMNSEYYMRKANIQEQILEQFTQQGKEVEKTPTENFVLTKHDEEIAIESTKQHFERKDIAKVNLKPWSRIPELLASSTVLVILLGLGIRNINIFQGSSATLGTKTVSASPSPSASPEPKIMLTVKFTDAKVPINIREKPTTQSKIIGEAHQGDTFKFVSQHSDWSQVNLPDGSTGFIFSTFVEKEQEANND